MSDELPPALRGLREDLREAAARDAEIELRVAQRLRGSRRRRALLVLAAIVVSSAGVAVAGRAIDREGPAVAPDKRPLPPSVVAGADPGVIASGAVADPDGGPPWALRVFTNAKGLECVALGRLRNGTIGRYDPRTRTFHVLPRSLGGTCEPLGDRGMLVAAERRAGPPARTIVYGLVRDRGPVRVTIAGETSTLRPGALGSFIDVRSGVLDFTGARVSTAVGDRTATRPLG
ncbi:MAG: hypothetical protein QOE31_2563 [Solirubrobacteraceae bacterium]|nr:hypothetical protein [Solirubrobacteraceae bacterium]